MRVATDIGTSSLARILGGVNVFPVSACKTACVSPLIRRSAIVGVAAGLAFAAWKFLASRAADTGGVTYQPQPFPMPPKPIPAPNFVDATAEGSCPTSHPIKGKLTSGIYHQPGGFAYERTHADRCYRNPTAAESDGLRAAKR